MRASTLAKLAPAVLLVLLAPACAALGSQPVEEMASESPLRAGFLIIDGVYNTELTAPYDIFEHTAYHAQPGMEVFTVSPDGGPITTAEGLKILPDYSFETAPPIDILVVPSAQHSRDSDRQNRAMIDWVRETGSRARYVVSLCWGAFILAEAGLLDGHSCTTFPSDFKTFVDAFPDLDLRVNVSFVHDGKTLTSQGGTRSFDVAMYLVDLLYGQSVAAAVGRGLLIAWPPPTGTGPSFISDRSVAETQTTDP